jgi:hypothetical protein
MPGEDQPAHSKGVTVYTARTTREPKPAAVVFCSTGCLSQGENYAPGLSANCSLKTIDKDRATCLHCYNCGNICYRPDECAIHRNCPDNSWQLRGFQAMGFVRSWRTLTGDKNPTHDAWEIANCLGSLNPDINFVELAEIVLEEIDAE